MKTNKTSKLNRSIAFFAMCLAILGLQNAAHGAAFVKLGNIEGEAADTEHTGWIEVLSIDTAAHKPGGGATGQSRRRGGAVVEDVRLTMEYEKASPKLQEKCLMGEVIPKLEIALYRASSAGRAAEPYLKIEMTDILITSYQVISNADGPDTPSVLSITVSFATMTQTHRAEDGEETTLTIENSGRQVELESASAPSGRS